MYSKPPPTAKVAEVSTAQSNFDHRHSRRIGPTSIGVACRKTFCRPLAEPSAPDAAPRDPRAPSTALDPEHRVAILRFERKTKLHLNFLRAADEVENFFRLLRQAFKFARQPRQRLIQCNEFVSVFLQKFATGLKRRIDLRPEASREKKN